MNRLIASNRTARYAIVIASDATEQERYAADELRYYLERMTSAPRMSRRTDGILPSAHPRQPRWTWKIPRWAKTDSS